MNRIPELRKERGISMKQAAEQLGMPYTTYVNYEKGVRQANSETLIDLANFYNTSIDYMLGKSSDRLQINGASTPIPPGFIPMPPMRKVPLVGSIACGTPILAQQNIDGSVDAPEDIRCDFALRCKGDSMIDAGIHDGDAVYIRIQPEVENGEIAAVRIGEEATLKRVYYDGTTLTLMPANAAFAPMVYTGPQLEEVHIEGRVVGWTHWVG